jgi:hypothetical protein
MDEDDEYAEEEAKEESKEASYIEENENDPNDLAKIFSGKLDFDRSPKKSNPPVDDLSLFWL